MSAKSHISPAFAAELAESAYLLIAHPVAKVAVTPIASKFKGRLDVTGNNIINGVAGGVLKIVQSRTSFGLLALGDQESDAYKNDAFIILRGTAKGADILTDLNAGLKSALTGAPVHQGFQDCFSSFSSELMAFAASPEVAGKTIHCIGHSLGGALASLAADYLSTNLSNKVCLYTFGSPRVGLDHFCSRTTTNVLPQNIYRVAHQTDPVTMVPTWPFIHLPYNKKEYLLKSDMGALGIKWHFMKNYIGSVNKDSWDTLSGKRPQQNLTVAAQRWLKSDGPISLTANTLSLLDASLMYVLKKVFHAVGISVTIAGSLSLTVLDRLAYILHKSINLGKQLSFWVYRLIKRMMQMLGMKVVDMANLTQSFIKRIFRRMSESVAALVSRAVHSQ